MPAKCSKAVSVPLGLSDHNLVAIKRITKIPKAPSIINYRRSFKWFNKELFEKEIGDVNWFPVCREEDPEAALSVFMELFMGIADKHAPLRKWTSRSKGAPWIDDELRKLMSTRHNAKGVACRTCALLDRQN